MDAGHYGRYYKNRLEAGQLYQDFVVDCCWDLLGLAIVQYASREYQRSVGESRTGAEIKYDQKFSTTGNLWIELGEKARPRGGDYVESGINRSDNTWLYIIGDYDTVFIFAKRFLKAMAASGRYQHRENNTKTSIAFLLPRIDAEKYAAQILYPNAAQKIGKQVMSIDEMGAELHRLVRRLSAGQKSLFDE